MATTTELRERLEVLDEGSEDAPERLAVLADLGWQLRFDDPEEGEALAEEAHRLASTPELRAARAQAARALLMYRRWRHDLAGALEVGLAAVADFRELEDRQGLAAALDGVATIVELLGDYPAALEYARQAYEVAVETGDPSRRGWALTSLGGIHAACGDHEEAIAILEEAAEAFRAGSDLVGLGRNNLRLGKIHLERGDVEAARARYEAIVEMSPAVFRGNVFGLDGLGDIARAEGDYERARQLYEQAEQNLARAGVQTMHAEVQLSLVRLAIEEGKLDEAADKLTAMEQTAEDAGAKIMLAQIHELWAEIGERRGDFAEAYRRTKQLGSLRAEIASDEARAAIVHERSRREIESARKDAEIHRLRYVELAEMQAKLVQSEKLAALGQLAAGIAHELNTPLGALKSNLGVIHRALGRLDETLGGDGEPSTRKSLRAARRAADTGELAVARIERFVRSVTRYSGVDQGAERRFTQLRDCVETVLEVVAPNLPSSVRIDRRLQAVPPVWAHPALINQALMAVITHAVESVREGGEVTVALRREEEEVVLAISNDGSAIPERDLARIFDPSFESKGERVQLALGLPTVAAAMNALGGRARAQTETGRGITIALHFPTTAPPSSA